MTDDTLEPGDAEAEGAGAAAGVKTRFVWPPRPHTPATRPALQPATVPLSHWEEFEREWLGVAAAPLHRRLAEAGVVPDLPDAFCWRCARTVGPYETDGKGCSQCRGTRPHWDRFVRLAEYQQPWRQLVWDAKFTRWPRLAVDLGRLLGRQVAVLTPDLADRPTVVVPVPTNLWRRLLRGTDHSLNIARGVARELGVPVRNLLGRSARPEQASLSRTDREKNLRGAMRRGALDPLWSHLGLTAAARWPCGADAARVVVVDDISTTGATMHETCRMLRQMAKALKIKDLEIVGACVCRTEPRRRF